MSYEQRIKDSPGVQEGWLDARHESQLTDIGVDADARVFVLEEALIAAVGWNWIEGVEDIPEEERDKIISVVQRVHERRIVAKVPRELK